MRYLFNYQSVIRLHNFKCFSQYWIEWFPLSQIGIPILGKNEDCYHTQSFELIFLIHCIFHYVNVMNHLTHFLEHGNGFIEPNWHCNSGKILSNCTLENCPNTETLLLWSHHWQCFSHVHSVCNWYSTKSYQYSISLQFPQIDRD